MVTLISYMCDFWLDFNLASPVVKLAWTWRFGAETKVCGFMVSTSIIASWSRKQVLWMCTAKTWHRGTGIGDPGKTLGLKYMKVFLKYTDNCMPERKEGERKVALHFPRIFNSGAPGHLIPIFKKTRRVLLSLLCS